MLPKVIIALVLWSMLSSVWVLASTVKDDEDVIFMGDSGERDPEIYGEIAREHPGQILHIFIRALEPGRDDKRYRVSFQNVEQKRWTVFHEAEELNLFSIPR